MAEEFNIPVVCSDAVFIDLNARFSKKDELPTYRLMDNVIHRGSPPLNSNPKLYFTSQS